MLLVTRLSPQCSALKAVIDTVVVSARLERGWREGWRLSLLFEKVLPC